MHTLDWSDLQFVLSVAETGSLAAAARRLGVHHATVLRRINSFEQAVGVNVFDRSGSGYRLTPESAHILATVQKINDQVEALNRTVATQEDMLSGPFRLTTTDSLCHAVVQQQVWQFQRSYPAIQIELLSRNDELDFARLEADMTIRPALALPADLSGTRVCEMGFRVYASPAYLADKDLTNPAQLDWIGASPPLSRAPFVKWMNENIADHQIVFRADTFMCLLPAAQAGLGLTFLPCCIAESADNLVRVDTLKISFTTGLWVATHKDLVNSPKFKLVAGFFEKALKLQQHLISG
ncbi:MAG: DNA-binding transcriptional LysR family regulator [Gammaproteobacteria bacterium]|jgi:DNA-binding transcriptional LysR family regulator